MSDIRAETEHFDGQARRLIAAFPATGKSHYAERHDNVADSDSSVFSWIEPGVRHPDWPHNYLRHIKAELLDGRTVLVSTHAEVRGLLADEELPFTLVYPERHLRDEYVRRMVDRGSPDALCRLVAEKWSQWITEMHEQACAVRIVLGAGDYLADVMEARWRFHASPLAPRLPTEASRSDGSNLSDGPSWRRTASTP